MCRRGDVIKNVIDDGDIAFECITGLGAERGAQIVNGPVRHRNGFDARQFGSLFARTKARDGGSGARRSVGDGVMPAAVDQPVVILEVIATDVI